MNYLAHLYLADDDPQSIIGNLMGDFVKGRVDESLPPALRRGILMHRKIDVFADTHPAFQTSKRRLRPEYRRYAGILVDVFYDHFLACNWDRYSAVALEHFSDRVYRILRDHYQTLPGPMQRSVIHMIRSDLLVSYRSLAGIARALRGIEGRLKRPSRLGEAIAELELNYAALGADFADFFPELIAYVRNKAISETL